MKQQIPSILAKFFRKQASVVSEYEFSKTDLPGVGEIYRDNTNGLLWKVIAHSGEYRKNPDMTAEQYISVSLSKRENQRERMVILQSVDHEEVVIHIRPEVLKSKIHSSQHYEVAVKTTLEIDRFSKLDEIEKESGWFWSKGVKTMSTEKALHTLLDPKTTSLYVLNVYPTKHGLAELPLEWFEEGTQRSRGAKIRATWCPQDLLESVPKEALVKNQTFRRYLDGGFILPITTGSANRIKDTPEYQVEVARLIEQQPATRQGIL